MFKCVLPFKNVSPIPVFVKNLVLGGAQYFFWPIDPDFSQMFALELLGFSLKTLFNFEKGKNNTKK